MEYKLLVLCFVSFFILSQLTSPTTASFNDTEQVHFQIPLEENFKNEHEEVREEVEENTESKNSDDAEEQQEEEGSDKTELHKGLDEDRESD